MVWREWLTRRALIFLGLQLCLACLALRLAAIQVFDHARYRALADKMEETTLLIEPRRGAIYDRNGLSLAVTTDILSLYANPRAVAAEERGPLSVKLGAILDMDAARIAELLARDKFFAWIKRKLGDDEVRAVRELNAPALGFRTERQRCYPNGRLLCHVLGFVGVDGEGLEGLEGACNATLAGVPGEETVQLDGLGREIKSADSVRKPAVDGRSLVLTIDMRMQQALEEELAAACEKNKPDSACAVALDPWTGDVLAMAGWPTFDPKDFRGAPAARLKNPVVSDCMEPGSSFKPFVAALALERRAVTADTRFDCHNGVYRLGGRTLHDSHGYGVLSVRDIIAFSSNIGMAQVGARLGAQPMCDGLSTLGFGRPTGIDLPGESAGILHPVSRWSKLTISSIPMGQEVAVSPIQLAAGFCIFANGGWLVRPRITLGVSDLEGRRILQPGPAVQGRRVLSRETAQLMCRDLLGGVVERGTAHSSEIPGYPMSGKTGTAQIANANARGYEAGAYTAIFVGIVPKDAPRFVIGIMVRKPQGGSHYGGVVAAPAVARTAERLLSMCRVPRVADSDKSQLAMKRRNGRSGD